MKNVILLLFTVLVLSMIGCQDVTVGYLLTEDASYNPDTLVVKTVLDDELGEEDYYRSKWGAPWVSTPIEGVEGTIAIYVSIKNITSTSGDPEKLWKVLSVRGDGTFEIPLYHDVPAGRYVISLNFRNEGYSKDVNDWFHDNREIANIRGAFTKLPGERDCSQPVSLPGLFFLPHLVRCFSGVCYPLDYGKVPETTVSGHVMNSGECSWYVDGM